MVMDIVHELKYIIKFKNPVDKFNVIKQIQIDLRNDFVGDQNMVEVISIKPDNPIIANSDFFAKYQKLYNSKHWIPFSSEHYQNISLDNVELINIIKKEFGYLSESMSCGRKLSYYDENKPFENLTESDYINLWLDYMNSFKSLVDNIVLDINEQLLIQTIKSHPDVVDNIDFIGWTDKWMIY
jgi:hypothetical protein